jgi:hypothetical protein
VRGIKARVNRAVYCCGVYEIGAFGSDYAYMQPRMKKKDIQTGFAYFSVTRRGDITQKAWLKLAGFKKVGTWKNPNTGRWLTMWAYFPEKRKRK